MQIMNTQMYPGLGTDAYNGTPFTATNPYGQSVAQPQYPQQQMMPQMPKIDPRIFDTPQITMGENHKPLFSISDAKNTITVPAELSDMEKAEIKRSKRSAGKKEVANINNGGIVSIVPSKADNSDIEDPATIYSYNETTGLLHETLGQIDAINTELVREFENVKHNRTMKNKYNVLNELSANIGSLISNRISVIREINNSITKSNDLDYKKYKDIKAAQSSMSDDKYIADLYQAFMQNPQNQPVNLQMSTPVDPAIYGSGIVRANITPAQAASNAPIDAGYLNYLANLTPEQNMMRYESDPNVKQVVVYDAATGAKFFQIMNVLTGEVIPNAPVYDQMFMEDTTLDLKTKVAKNLNMNESFPIIVLNDNITSQY